MLTTTADEPFEDMVANWLVGTEANGTGSTVIRSDAQQHGGVFSAAAFTMNANSKAQVSDVISSNWSGVPSAAPGAFIWQRAYVYVPSATVNALSGSEYLDLGGLYASGDSSGFYLRLKASAALYASGPGTTGQAEFNLYGTFPLDQWVEVELGLWSRNTGDLDRAGCFLINGKFYGWFTNGRSGTNYNRAAMGIVTTNSADNLTVYVDDWYLYGTGAGPTGTDLRPTGAIYTKDYTTQSGENIGYHYATWENGYTINAMSGLFPDTRIQSAIETSRMPDLSDGWSQIVIDWPDGNMPPWPPDRIGQFFGPMIAFRKSVELEENLEVVPVYRSGTGSVDLVFESWTAGPIEYAKWQLPLDAGGHRIPGRGDIIRIRWQEISATQIRVRVDYFDASTGIWTVDAIDDTRALNNVNGVNFLDDTHRAVTNTIDSNDYSIRSQTIGTLASYSGLLVTQVARGDPNPTNAASVHFNVTFSAEVTGVDPSDFLLTTTGLTGASLTAVQGSGAAYLVTVNTGSGNGTIRLDVLDDDSIRDGGNNLLGGTGVGNGNFTAGETYTVLKTAVITGNAGANSTYLIYTDGTPQVALADGSGNYSITVPYGWSGTVTPSLPGVTFTPPNRSYTNVTSGQTGQNYSASVTLSGNAAAPGATLGYVDGTPQSITADDSGNYSITLPYGWRGTVTPSLSAEAFCPASQMYSNLTTSRTAQNYAQAACPNFGSVSKWSSGFDLSHGWTVSDYVRTVGDVSGDGRADVVGFGQNGVYVALSTGNGFGSIKKWLSAFDLSHGWTVSDNVRTIGDVNGDGKADVVGFGLDGVYVALSTGSGFSGISKWTSGFDLSHGWTVRDFVRTVGDVNGDGKADLVGFGLDGVYVATSTGSGFSSIGKWTNSFDLSHGWTVSQYVRTVGDVNGDGKADLVGFGQDGVYVALSTGGAFGAISKWTSGFALANGWTVSQYVRTVGDMNGDGRADLVGFGLDGVYIGLSTGNTFSLGSRRTTSFDLSHGWTVAQYVRTVGDVNAGGKADLVGFGQDGVYVATVQ